MALWGKTSNAESRPKSLPMDSNSSYSREFVTANKKGWVFQPGTASAATGNDNASAAPEILVVSETYRLKHNLQTYYQSITQLVHTLTLLILIWYLRLTKQLQSQVRL